MSSFHQSSFKVSKTQSLNKYAAAFRKNPAQNISITFLSRGSQANKDCLFIKATPFFLYLIPMQGGDTGAGKLG